MFRPPKIVPIDAPAISPRQRSGSLDLSQQLAGAEALARALWASRSWIAAGMLAGLFAAGLFLVVATPRYGAVAELLIDPADLHVVDKAVTSSAAPTAEEGAQIESQVRVLVSDSVLRRVIEREGLDKDPEFTKLPWTLTPFLAPLAAAVGLKLQLEPIDPMALALRSLEKHVGARRENHTYVVTVSATTRSAIKSVKIANAIVQAYLADQAAARGDAARRATDALSSRLDELKGRVRDSEEKVEAYKAQHDIIGANGQSIREQQLAELNNQLIQARARTAEAKARCDQIELVRKRGADPGSIPEAVQSPTITSLRTQYAEVSRREAELSSRLGPRHPFVYDIKAQERDLHKLIGVEITRLAESTRGDYDRARTNQEALERNLDALKRDAVSISQSLVRLRELERDVEASRAVYEAFLVRSRETSEQERMNTANVRVLSEAMLPSNKEWPPNAALVAALGLMAGATAGAGLGFTRRRTDTDHRIWSRRDLEAASGLPVIAEIVDDVNGRWSATTQFVSKGDPKVLTVAGGPTILDAPDSRFAVGIRGLSELLRPPAGDSASRTLLLLAAGDSAARSKVSLNLALSAASSGNNVLLVDADIGTGELTKLVGGQNNPGLLDVAMHRKGFHEALLGEPRTGLLVLPLGQTQSGLEYARAAADRAVKVLETARSFDVLVVDGPAPAQAPSALAASADFVILIAAAGKTRDTELTHLVAAAKLPPTKLRGAVLIKGTEVA
jgi:uncharacterized protein involved in exopolysaccharide biosynthesis/Mrp family chromosome partitioning ATPase